MASLIAVGFPNYLKLQNQWLLVRDWLFPRKSCKTCRSWYQNIGLGMRQVFGNPNWYQRFLLPSSLAYQSSLRPAWSIRTFLDWLSSGFEVAPSIYPTFSYHFILLPPSSLQRPRKKVAVRLIFVLQGPLFEERSLYDLLCWKLPKNPL